MRQRIVPLTDVQVKNAKPKDKDYKLSDGQGLYLYQASAADLSYPLPCDFGDEQLECFLYLFALSGVGQFVDRLRGTQQLMCDCVSG